MKKIPNPVAVPAPRIVKGSGIGTELVNVISSRTSELSAKKEIDLATPLKLTSPGINGQNSALNTTHSELPSGDKSRVREVKRMPVLSTSLYTSTIGAIKGEE